MPWQNNFSGYPNYPAYQNAPMPYSYAPPYATVMPLPRTNQGMFGVMPQGYPNHYQQPQKMQLQMENQRKQYEEKLKRMNDVKNNQLKKPVSQ